MNTYNISPRLVRVTVDSALSQQFADLDARLAWRPLTTNLESCEDLPYLYFCINLVQHRSSPTYAGFSSGAPFMLTREKDLKKRAFFLRHWVRMESIENHKDASLVRLQHMTVAVQGRRLLVRVNIDRAFNTADAFKSVPFATFMFQVAHVDAFIEGLPDVRFAFAIERTITSEEREIVGSMGHSIPSKGMKTKPAPSSQPTPKPNPYLPHPTFTTIPRPARPFMPQPKMLQTHQPAQIPTPSMQQSVVPQRNVAYSSNSVRSTPQGTQSPYQFASSRIFQPQLGQKPSPRALPIAPQALKPVQRNYNRSMATPPPLPVAQNAPLQVDNSNKIVHPYMKLWEDHDMDDPYEPIFITKDEKFDSKANRTFIFENTPPYASRVDHRNLFGMPSNDYPQFYLEDPDIAAGGVGQADPDVEILFEGPQKSQEDCSDLTASSLDDTIKKDDRTGYLAAVVAASKYNAGLREGRNDLRKWLVEDLATREEDGSEEEHEEDEGDQDSSE